MSKAFTKESDDAGENRPAPRPPLPPGVPNRITPGGAERLRRELAELLDGRRAAGQTADGRLDSRIRQVQQILESVVATPPPAAGGDRVAFGATVKVRRENGQEETYRIVGVEEIALDRGHVSWLSPLARALLSRRAGDTVQFPTPEGEGQLLILSVEFSEV